MLFKCALCTPDTNAGLDNCSNKRLAINNTYLTLFASLFHSVRFTAVCMRTVTCLRWLRI